MLIVDSGSTKTDWAILDGSKPTLYSSRGINPSSDHTFITLSEHSAELATRTSEITDIHYYGAGVIDQITKDKIRSWLKLYFINAQIISVNSDLLGACRALAGRKKGLISILGTGCNSCLYDGTNITDNIPSLGFIVSNEGAGTDIGRAILKSYFYRQMPERVKLEFESKYAIHKSSVVRSLYQESNPTSYLAGYARFINETSDSEWRKSIVYPLFQTFIDTRIKTYSQYMSYELYFVGSIAYFCSDILKEILENNNLRGAMILQKPIDGLIIYHTKTQA